MPRDIGVVVVAAGRSLRMGGDLPKQFRRIRGVPMLLRALRPFLAHDEVRHVVVVLPPDRAASPPPWLRTGGVELTCVAGGEERMDSVEAGVAALSQPCRGVLVHDGARPFVTAGVVDAVIRRVQAGTAAVAAVPLHDTLKSTIEDDDRRLVSGTVSREGLWRAQTPQGFARAQLEEAFAAARRDGVAGTDEAMLIERLGHPVEIVPDSPWNIKVTTPDDFALAECIARGKT